MLVFAIVFATLALRTVLSAGTSTRERAESTRERLRELRFAVNSCVAVMGVDEQAVQIRLLDTDSLRARIDALESLDARGVPQDSFPTYMELVDRYNRTVAAWDTLGEQARRRREECNDLVNTHNVLSDSLRTLLTETGLLPNESCKVMVAPFIPGSAPKAAVVAHAKVTIAKPSRVVMSPSKRVVA